MKLTLNKTKINEVWKTSLYKILQWVFIFITNFFLLFYTMTTIEHRIVPLKTTILKSIQKGESVPKFFKNRWYFKIAIKNLI